MNATVAQLVEYDLAKVGVAGSNPVCRSYKNLNLRIEIFSLYRKVLKSENIGYNE